MEATEFIVVLEDDGRRIDEMRRVAAESLQAFDCIFFDNANELLSWLATHMSQTRLLSLDCDLDSTAAHSESDVGSGSDVADYLAGLPAFCPVLIHSSNAMRAPAMHMKLSFAGWPTVKLCPFTDAKSWLADVLNALEQSQTC